MCCMGRRTYGQVALQRHAVRGGVGGRVAQLAVQVPLQPVRDAQRLVVLAARAAEPVQHLRARTATVHVPPPDTLHSGSLHIGKRC